MKVDKFGQQILNENDLCGIFMKDPQALINGKVLVDRPIPFSEKLELTNVPKLTVYRELEETLQDFDSRMQNSWLMPDQYKDMDIAKWVLDQCVSDEEVERAGQELIMFAERDLLPLLQYLKYLVDTMRENKIVWGVGRGSSVASFVLFIIGVHKINSLKYKLSVTEFLK